MPKVLNKYKDTLPEDAVYIGRPSPWGNPFVINKTHDRDYVVFAYEKWLLAQPDLCRRMRNELKGKDLICFCSPRACHGDVIMRIANE